VYAKIRVTFEAGSVVPAGRRYDTAPPVFARLVTRGATVTLASVAQYNAYVNTSVSVTAFPIVILPP
jgi:hypothetical protein